MTTSSSGFFSFVVISLERFSAVDFSPLFFWLFFKFRVLYLLAFVRKSPLSGKKGFGKKGENCVADAFEGRCSIITNKNKNNE